MNFTRTEIEDVVIIEPKVFGDHRGWFSETYSKRDFENAGLAYDFIQDNQSMSAKMSTLRGLHFQINPKAQTKLIRCTKGEILDVAVDLREGSPTYKAWVSVELTEANKKQLLIPKGFAHGFLTLTDDVEVQYKVDEYYSLEHDSGIKYNDTEIAVAWDIDNPILSDKDLNAKLLADSNANFKYTYLVTGVEGQLGYDVVKRLKELGRNVIAPKLSEFDLTNQKQLEEYLFAHKPNVIIHCAAYTAVDKAETDKDLCKAVNVDGTAILVNIAKRINATFMYISTDYVFDGINGEMPHQEYDEIKPINYYGWSKSEGEKIVQTIDKHFIVRTSWVFGVNGNNFVKTMLRLAESRDELSIIDDQIGSPTYTDDLAKLMLDILDNAKYGIYHGTNAGYTSWYDFAKEIFRFADIDVRVKATTTENYPTPAKRPHNSRLSKQRLVDNNIDLLPTWQGALKRYLDELKKEKN